MIRTTAPPSRRWSSACMRMGSGGRFQERTFDGSGERTAIVANQQPGAGPVIARDPPPWRR